MKPEKKYPVTRSFLPPQEEFILATKAIWNTHWLTNQGPLHQEFEQALKTHLGIPEVTLFNNGHLALDVAIKALNLTGEVITTPYSFASTTHAIVMNGLAPVFCDIKPDDHTINEELIESLISPRTSAILAVHVYGNPCAVQAIEAIAKRHGLMVIYDAAHAFGETIDDRPITDWGDISMYSFHATKVFHSIEGGALVYAMNGLRRRFDLLKNFGITGPETVEDVGLNAKMNEFQAAMGLVNLRYIADEIAERQKVFEHYQSGLSTIPGLQLPVRKPGVRYNNSYYPVVIDPELAGINREEVFTALENYGIHTRKYFYPLIPDYDCYRQNYGSAHVPVARQTASRVLTIPMYGSLDGNDCDYIVEHIRRVMERR